VSGKSWVLEVEYVENVISEVIRDGDCDVVGGYITVMFDEKRLHGGEGHGLL
jgi:hypothetical protein